MTTTTYRTSPTKRTRRTKAEMEALRSALYEIVAQAAPASVRQVFYQAVSRGLVEKNEAEYKNTVCRLLADMRLQGEMPYGWIADGTRWQRKPKTHAGLRDALGDIHRTYRRNLWDNQDAYIEIWCEKEALAGVIYEVTARYDVPLMVTRGYPSLSFLASAAEDIEIEGMDSDVFIYYFGDFDPSGLDIARNVEERLDEMASDTFINFERSAVTADQVDEMALPLRPTKRHDTRARNWVGGSVELDAIEPDTLRTMVAGCIEQHVDPDALNVMQIVEAEERDQLERLINRDFTEMTR